MNECQNIKYKIDIEKAIKSFYNLKNIFSFLSEKQKLNIIINNKHLQKKFDINIKDYKRISGRYKVGERNGKGKEYDISTDVMLFEGEYLNGERNGKGKEYNWYSTLSLEGIYLNDKKLEYKGYKNINLVYELKEGKGLIKQYDKKDLIYNNKDELIFEGEYLNGQRIK